jgi:hypothetical protein
MSLGWVVAGTIMQLVLGFFMLLITIFAGAGISNGRKLSKFQTDVLTYSIYALPAICFISACIVIYLYYHDASALSYWWHVVSPIVAVAYFAFAVKLNKTK